MKRRWLTGFIVFLVFAGLVLPQGAGDLHFLLSGQTERLTLDPLKGWSTVLYGGRPMQLYLLLTAILALLILWVLVDGSSLNYRSGSWRVTPDIVTPAADGQGQFGTARWLQPRQIGHYYGIWRIPRQSEKLNRLLAAGQEDRKEIKNARITID